MARVVKVTIVYNMDDEEKLLSVELQDWLDGHVGVQDIFESNGLPSNPDSEDNIAIEELTKS